MTEKFTQRKGHSTGMTGEFLAMENFPLRS